MPTKSQYTGFYRNFGMLFSKLEDWTVNPWRRYSLYLIIFLTGFVLGSSLGMINGALSLMDPVGAFFTVLIIELMVRLRVKFNLHRKNSISLRLFDMVRMGLLYGLFMEGFKLF